MLDRAKVAFVRYTPVVAVLALAGAANAQSWGTPSGGTAPVTLDYAAYVNTVSAAVGTGITTAAPGLFLFVGAVTAFFFVWGRIRSIV